MITPPALPEREVFSVPALAARWGCDPRTVRTLIASGRLAAFPLGVELRITLDAVKAYETQPVPARAPARPIGRVPRGRAQPLDPKRSKATPAPAPAQSLLEQAAAINAKHRAKKAFAKR